MTRASPLLAACLAVIMAVAARPTLAAEAPFEPGLMRLAEVLGSLHFLRNLCGEKGDQWRVEMEKLLESENPDPERRARFIASFNRGYRSFSGTYTQCTASATEAIARYMKEGETLSRDIASRYGN
ncbi:TIGR02301 family protein [Mesorhizobium sp. M3A.F.Ca.ET.080.04.2.1]|uniref:TIGR02301 family protein n=1 Tax=Mesorhizobium sp. M3A.F.Ca.ET.080.04.2.1 TaxID=2493676 RepID=UPI000F762F9C|nr:TIGR02301 family protein [Mesorhizobium sp. M3A.F.Ca.ET.080.04.2.1]AZO09025.1 TIGR02301 family protein [Mesorhizobium sp. M3A.F.Ca.ET.080.04.2.1]RWF24707.1 MAG: TIGR02301 family protein [Mesorhizobium sp.]